MTFQEWESLCDGCARCCLCKFEDRDTEEVLYTNMACQLLDLSTCRCLDYAHRHQRVEECVKLSLKNVTTLLWLPPTCAYRLLAEGLELQAWHPLVSKDPQTVHEAGISIRHHAVHERPMDEIDIEIIPTFTSWSAVK